MKRSLIALVLTGSLATATVIAPTQAHARWVGADGEWVWAASRSAHLLVRH
jgi:hypothetical protein